jgi:hypothetical protein
MKKLFSSIILLFSIITIASAQSEYQPYSYQFYQQFSSDIYSTKTREHTSVKPFFTNDTLLKKHLDSLLNYGADNKQHSWGYRKLFNEHLIDIKNPNSTLYADFLPDFTVGRDFSNTKNTYQTTYGFQVGGTVSNKFSFNVSGYLNQAIFPSFLSAYISQVGVIPGQAIDHNPGNVDNWSYLTAVASYTPVKYLNITMGRDKTFIGDGYRSLLLSDYSAPYPFFKLTGTLGNVTYMAMWARFDDPMFSNLNDYTSNRAKWGVFHYLDWNISNRLSFGFFDSIIWAAKDDTGQPRGFDVSYINPLIFLRPIEASDGSPDNALLGFTGKYKITDGITAYGQFALDEFEAKNFLSSDGSSRNKYSWQLGFRGASLFGVKNLNYLIESNNAKPYTYSERSVSQNYTGSDEPLAHPWGANFREIVGLLNYSYKRFSFSGEADYGHYGLDEDGLNYGKDLFQDYTNPAKAQLLPNGLYASQSTGNYTGQGLTTNMYYLEGKVAYLLNPKYNLRLEIGALYREEKSSEFNYNATMLTIGVRSSFRQIYTDIASYRPH